MPEKIMRSQEYAALFMLKALMYWESIKTIFTEECPRSPKTDLEKGKLTISHPRMNLLF